MANNEDQFEEITPEERRALGAADQEKALSNKEEKVNKILGSSSVSDAIEAAKTSDETADEQAERFTREDAEAAAKAASSNIKSVKNYRDKTGKQRSEVVTTDTGSKPVTETLSEKEAPSGALKNIQEAADAGAPVTDAASRILNGDMGQDEAGVHNRNIQNAVDEMEPYDFNDPAQFEKWKSTMDQRIADAAAVSGSENRVAVSSLPSMAVNTDPGQAEAETLSKGRNLPQTVFQEQRAAQKGTKLEGLAEQTARIGSGVRRQDILKSGDQLKAAVSRGINRFLNPTLLRDYQGVTAIRHAAFMKKRGLVRDRATISALASLLKAHDSKICVNPDCYEDRKRVDGKQIIPTDPVTARNSPRSIEVSDPVKGKRKVSIFRRTGDLYKAQLGLFIKHHGEDPEVQAEVSRAVNLAHIKHGTRYDEEAGRTSQPETSDWQETEPTEGDIAGWAERPENKNILEKVALTRHLNEFSAHPIFGQLVDHTSHPHLFSSDSTPISVSEVVRAISAHRGFKTAHPELIDEDHAIAIPQSMTHQRAVEGSNGLYRNSHNAFLDVPNRVSDIYGSTGKNTNVSGVQVPWGKGEKEAAAQKAKTTGFDKHIAWAKEALSLLGHINNMRELKLQNQESGVEKAAKTRAGVTSETTPGAMPAEGRVRPSQRPDTTVANNVDLAQRLIDAAKSLAGRSGTVVQDGAENDEYGTRPRDLITTVAGTKAPTPAESPLARAMKNARVRLGLPAQTAEDISPKLEQTLSDPSAVTSIIPRGEVGRDYLPGGARGGNSDETIAGTATRNPEAAATRITREHIISERDKALEPIMARVAVHNATRADNNQRPHALPQALAHLGLTKAHADIHAKANAQLASLVEPD